MAHVKADFSAETLSRPVEPSPTEPPPTPTLTPKPHVPPVKLPVRPTSESEDEPEVVAGYERHGKCRVVEKGVYKEEGLQDGIAQIQLDGTVPPVPSSPWSHRCRLPTRVVRLTKTAAHRRVRVSGPLVRSGVCPGPKMNGTGVVWGTRTEGLRRTPVPGDQFSGRGGF